MKKILTFAIALMATLSITAQADFIPTTQAISVTVGGIFGPYVNESVTYEARLYTEGTETKLDVRMCEYNLPHTQIGDLTLGTYTVCGLVYDEEKDGYYRDYTGDNISFHFKSSGGFDSDYVFTKLGNLLVKMDGTSIAYACNNFTPGAMPFPIVSNFGTDPATGIDDIQAVPVSTPATAKRIEGNRIIIERGGKRYTATGVEVR